MARSSGRRVAWAIVALLALGSWPWIGSLTLWPMAPDSGLWIERGATFDPEWTRWVFGTRHFHVGYRPVTALSYTLDWIAAGARPLAYRATDLALHLCAALGVFAVHRRLFRSSGPWAAVLAMGLFLAHPAAEDVVPFIARRSYALSTALALAGLAVWLGGEHPPSRHPALRHVFAGALLALALLSNEVAVLPAAALPFLAWARSEPAPDRLRRLAGQLLPVGLLLLAAVLLRTWVVGGIGGYQTTADGAARFLPVLAAAWRAVAGLPTPLPDAVLPAAWLLLAVAGPYYLVRCLRGRAELGILGLWIVAATVLFGLQDVWFPRQGYVLATPAAMLVAEVLAETRPGAHGRLRRWLAVAPQAMFLGALLAGSAVVFGPDARRLREWGWRNALIDDMVGRFGALEEPACVQTVLPFKRGEDDDDSLKGAVAERALPRSARQPVTWVRLLLRDHDLVVQEYAYVLREDFEELAPPELDASTSPPTILMPPGREYLVRHGARWIPADADADRRLAFAPPERGEPRPVYLYLAGVAGGRLLADEP